MKAQPLIVIVFMVAVTLLLMLAMAEQGMNAKADIQSPLSIVLTDRIESCPNSDITFTPAFTVYLPAVLKMIPGIYGKVTYQGTSVSGLKVQLLDNLGTKVSTVTMQTDGGYLFAGVPSLPTGQTYWVRYFNGSSGGNTTNPN
jgi:hypothetical protein